MKREFKNSFGTLLTFCCMVLALSLLIVLPCNANETTAISVENRLKIVCMYNFTKFTHWPDNKNLEDSDAIMFGIVGESPFGDAIKEMQAQLKKKHQKNIKTVFHGPYKQGMDLGGSHVLFISASERRNMHAIIAGLKGAPVLTVSDTDGFLEAGGMISLVKVNERIRWEINRTAIESAKIRVSSKLLQLAVKVENSSGGIYFLPFEQDKITLEHISREFIAYLTITTSSHLFLHC